MELHVCAVVPLAAHKGAEGCSGAKCGSKPHSHRCHTATKKEIARIQLVLRHAPIIVTYRIDPLPSNQQNSIGAWIPEI